MIYGARIVIFSEEGTISVSNETTITESQNMLSIRHRADFLEDKNQRDYSENKRGNGTAVWITEIASL